MIPLTCTDRSTTRALPREPSSRTDLQLRDNHTELSTIVYRRGFFTWAKSLLNYEWITGGVSALGGTACIPGAVTTVYGLGELYQTHVWSQSGTSTELHRRANDPKFSAAVTKYHTLIRNWTFPGVHHHTSGEGVTLWDVARANSTHPITVLHSNRAFRANHSHAVNVWLSLPNPGSGVPRFHSTVAFPYSNATSTSTSTAPLRVCSGAVLGQISECVVPGATVPPNAPKTMYYGFDLYGTKAHIEEFQADLGSTYDNENGFVPSIEAMVADVVQKDAWDTCVCQMTQNTWISTGSIQMSWDDTYN
ncbi:hypothetical protein B0H13DRAFT_2304306 [Mycena leptocephala]|nr:hypothetical protein B0H13DRAFT_2304306 [Mycena leptocephala]